jgi:hypothetical protein
MLEGLIQSYIDAFDGGWQPRDVYLRHAQDSKSRRRALRSPQRSGGDCYEDSPDNAGCHTGSRT